MPQISNKSFYLIVLLHLLCFNTKLSSQNSIINPKWIIVDSEGNLLRNGIKIGSYNRSEIITPGNKLLIKNYLFVSSKSTVCEIKQLKNNKIVTVRYLNQDSTDIDFSCGIFRAIFGNRLSNINCQYINQIQDFDVFNNNRILFGTKNEIILYNKGKIDTIITASKISLSYTTGIYSPIFLTSNSIAYIDNNFDKKKHQINSQIHVRDLKSKNDSILLNIINAFLIYRVNKSDLVILCKDDLSDNGLYRLYYYSSGKMIRTDLKLLGGYFF